MPSEHEILLKFDDSSFVSLCTVFEVLKHLDFNGSLVMEFLLVSNHFECDLFSCFRFMVFTSVDFTERPSSKDVNDFISIGDMIIFHEVVISSLIIISTIRCLDYASLYFLNSWFSHKIDFSVIKYLSFLKVRYLVCF